MGAEVYVFDRNIDRLRELEHHAQRPRVDRASPRRSRSSSGCRRSTSSSARCSSTARKAPHVDHARAAGADEAERGARRRLDRPGRLLRDLAPDDAHRPDLRGRRRSPTTASRTCPARCRSRSTYALTNATMPYVVKLADQGVHGALARRPGLHRRPQRRRRQGDLRAGRARPGPRVHLAAGSAGPRGRRGLRTSGSLLLSSVACPRPASSSARAARPSRRSSPRRV